MMSKIFFSNWLLTPLVLSFAISTLCEARVKLQRYPAIDENELPSSPLLVSEHTPLSNQKDESPFEQRLKIRNEESAAKKGVEQQAVAQPSKEPAVAKTEAPKPGFDAIPEGYSDTIAERLKLIEKLIRDYGRAYDYRSLTSTQLQSILSELEQEKQSQKLN